MNLLPKELALKKIGDLTVKEFAEIFPGLIKKKYYVTNGTEVKGKILEMIEQQDKSTIWDIARELDLEYSVVRYNAKLMIKEKTITGTKEKNPQGRTVIFLSKRKIK